MDQTNSLENIKQQNTSNIENLSVDPKQSSESSENKPSTKKKIIIIITIIVLILVCIGLILFIVLRKKGHDPDPSDQTDIILPITNDNSDDMSQLSDSNETSKISDSSVPDADSTLPNPIPTKIEPIPTFIIINTGDFSSDSI